MNGAFQTSRDIFENPIWQNIVEFRLFFLIYGKAIFADKVKIGNVILKRGQWIRSYRNLQSDLEYIENRSIKKYSLSTIHRAVENLLKAERIKIIECELGTLFEVVNYSKYQGFDIYKNNIENGERTEREQQQNGERTATERRENNNKNVKNLKNDKNVKNDKKSTYAFFDNPELNDTFLSFIDYRISIKAKMTNRAIELMISKLKKECASDSERIETLNNSILNGWKGIFPKSDTKYPQKKSIKDNFEQHEYTDEQLESLYKNSD